MAGPPANLPHDLCLVDLVDRRGEHVSIRGMKIHHEFPFHCKVCTLKYLGCYINI